jgi:NhaP-type Na+/H+ or K+/H+ antiporter
MSPYAVVLLGAGAVFAITVVSGRLHRVWLTEPLVAAVLGLLAGLTVVGPLNMLSEGILTILELILALVLFADASRIDITRLREGYSWPLRMLVLGLPLAVAFGALLAGWGLGAPLGVALLVGVVLAPTDAALAEPVLESETVPIRIRQTVNVESGLNDGLALPLLLIAIGLIESEEGRSAISSIGLVLAQLGIGIVGGLVIGWLGATLIGKGSASGWMTPLHQRIAAVALALAGFALVQLLGGSGFVATFIAGGLMSHLIQPRSEYLYEFAEAEGHSLVLLAFFIFGAGPATDLVTRAIPLEAIVIGVVSLVIVRPLAIALSLWGQRLSGRTVLFLGWFGPRGLATIVFALVAWEELGAVDPMLADIVNFTVLTSIIVHGLSAVPMSRWVGSMPMTEDMPEMGEAFSHPMRRA